MALIRRPVPARNSSSVILKKTNSDEIEVVFRDKDQEDPDFVIVLSKRMDYEQMASAVAQRLRTEPCFLQFFKVVRYHDCNPRRRDLGPAISSKFGGTLKEVFSSHIGTEGPEMDRPWGTGKQLFYQRLLVPITELEYREQMQDNILLTTPRTFREDIIDLRCTNIPYDITIKIGASVFPAHKLVLTQASLFFEIMFLGSFGRELISNEIELQDVEAEAFEQILDYIYTGKLDITPSNAVDILLSAHVYDLKYLVKAAADTVGKLIAINNAVELYHIAILLDLRKLKRKVVRFISMNLENISKCETIPEELIHWFKESKEKLQEDLKKRRLLSAKEDDSDAVVSLEILFRLEGSLSTVHDHAGSLSTVHDHEGSLSTAYDSEGSLSTIHDYEGSFSTVHDQEGSLSTVHDHEGSLFADHDHEGSLSTVHDSEGSLSAVHDHEGSLSTVCDREGYLSTVHDHEGSLSTVHDHVNCEANGVCEEHEECLDVPCSKTEELKNFACAVSESFGVTVAAGPALPNTFANSSGQTGLTAASSSAGFSSHVPSSILPVVLCGTDRGALPTFGASIPSNQGSSAIATLSGPHNSNDCHIAELEDTKRNLQSMCASEIEAIDAEIQQLRNGNTESSSSRGIPPALPAGVTISTTIGNAGKRENVVPYPDWFWAHSVSLSTSPVVKTEMLTRADHDKLVANQIRVSRAASSFAVKVEPETVQYKSISDKMKSYVDFEINRVVKIVNAEALSNYNEAKDQCFDPLHTDLKVYSSTVSRMERIARDGFSETDLEQGVYGHGIYFLENYAEDENIFDNACVFLCEVAVGHSLTIKVSIPSMNNAFLNKKGYDSVHGRDNPEAVTERYVVYNPYQVYPKYAVYFKPEALDIVSYSLQPTRFVNIADQLENQFRAVENELFRSRVRDQLTSIEYVKNCYAEQKFLLKHSELRIIHGNNALEAKKVISFHGTGRANIEKILQNNFDLTLAGRHGRRFGTGVYFSKSPSTALDYSRIRDDSGASKTIIACYILPGKSVDYKERDIVCDSYNAWADGANIAVIKRNDQILPMFKLTFNVVPRTFNTVP